MLVSMLIPLAHLHDITNMVCVGCGIVAHSAFGSFWLCYLWAAFWYTSRCNPLHALIHLKYKVLTSEVCGLGSTSCLCCLVVLHSVPFSKPFAGFLCPCQENAEKKTPKTSFFLVFKICFCRFRYVFTCLVFSSFWLPAISTSHKPLCFVFFLLFFLAWNKHCWTKPSLPEVSIHGSKKPLRLEWHKLKRPFSFIHLQWVQPWSYSLNTCCRSTLLIL